MRKLKCAGRRTLIVVILMALFTAAESQVMWNLKGGFMQRNSILRSYADGGFEEKSRPDWMAGMELEIPLNERLNIETGLFWKMHDIYFSKTFQFLYYDRLYTSDRKYDANQLAELPLRLAYKQQLGKHFSLHVGVGPYVSYVLNSDWRQFALENDDKLRSSSEAKWRNANFGDRMQVGLQPSIAINWACLSLGATYDIPCFYKGYIDENKPAVMATLGIRFKSHVWRYVGATLLTIVSVGAAASYAWSAANSGNYSSSSYSSGSSYGSSSSSYSGSKSSSVGNNCKFCAGTGECRSTTDRYHCRGTGECKKCLGKGYDTLNGNPYTCGYCHGSKKCHFCGGSGKCSHCGGTGKR